MKKFLVLILFLLMVIPCVAQEGFQTRTVSIDTTYGSRTWVLPDTSEVFPMYAWMSWKGFFDDTSGTKNDSCMFRVRLFTSSIASRSFDSTFTWSYTIFTATDDDAYDGDSAIAYHGGPTRVQTISTPPERFGVLIIDVLASGAQKDSAIVGSCYLNGWTNQPGVNVTKVGPR